MMRLDDHGGRIFTLDAPHASVVEVTIDFGGGVVRTLAMHRRNDRWMLRLHPGLTCLRYRFRIDGRTIPSPDRNAIATDVGDGWRVIRPAA